MEYYISVSQNRQLVIYDCGFFSICFVFGKNESDLGSQSTLTLRVGVLFVEWQNWVKSKTPAYCLALEPGQDLGVWLLF